MSTVLIAETGRSTGSANARRTRSAEAIPAVVYGHGMTPLSIQVARRDLPGRQPLLQHQHPSATLTKGHRK